jgi:predicted transcriptional regulator
MSQVKEAVIKMIQALPDDCTLEDIEYELEVRKKVEQGLADIEAGRTYTQDEVERRMAEWLQSYGQKQQ